MKSINSEFILKVFSDSQMKRELEKVFDEDSIKDFEEDFVDLVRVIIGSPEIFI